MRNGIHMEQQDRIVRFVRRSMRRQFWAAMIVILLTIGVAAALSLAPSTPRALPAVAQVQGATASGSGVLISNTLLLSSARVTGTQKAVSVSFRDKPSLTGTVLFADSESDIALVQIQGVDPSVSPFGLGNSDALGVSDAVTAIGFPGGSYAENRSKVVSKTSGELITDVSPNPGNSGGALVAEDGTVVGVIGATQELGWTKDPGRLWAIPISRIRKVCRDHQVPID
jgi:S1-C subfamily serine protease